MLVTLALCLFYGSGMPMLYMAAALFFFVQYWLDKYMLLKSYKRPPQYDDYIANQSLSYMKWILIVHQIGFFMLFKGPVFSKTSAIADPATTTDVNMRLLNAMTHHAYSSREGLRGLQQVEGDWTGWKDYVQQTPKYVYYKEDSI
jgi:hypothetical protein